jgi:hypothetical protein
VISESRKTILFLVHHRLKACMSNSTMASTGDDVVACRVPAFGKAVEQFGRALAHDPTGFMLWHGCIDFARPAAARTAVSHHR